MFQLKVSLYSSSIQKFFFKRTERYERDDEKKGGKVVKTVLKLYNESEVHRIIFTDVTLH